MGDELWNFRLVFEANLAGHFKCKCGFCCLVWRKLEDKLKGNYGDPKKYQAALTELIDKFRKNLKRDEEKNIWVNIYVQKMD